MGAAFVITSEGPIKRYDTRAGISVVTVAELRQESTIHVYDAAAAGEGSQLIVSSRAFLIVFSSRNNNRYAQFSRQPQVTKYCIPSYNLEELLRFCSLFQVTEEEVKERCADIGPSIRYVLTNNFEVCRNATLSVASLVKADAMDQYIDKEVSGNNVNISASLLVVNADEERFLDNPDNAYLERNVEWRFASELIVRTIMKGIQGSAKAFVINFIDEVNKRQFTRLNGMAGNYFEIIVDEFISSGKYSNCRKLGEVDNVNPMQPYIVRAEPFEIVDAGIKSLSKAFGNCLDPNALYTFCKSFPITDFMISDFLFCFQSTGSTKHRIHLDSMVAICDYVRMKHGEAAKVRLMFVVPTTVCTDTNWRYTQSFYYFEDIVVGGATVSKEHTCKFDKLSASAQYSLRNLEQWVIQWDLK